MPARYAFGIAHGYHEAPTRKAPGIDEVKAEMLKLDVELSTSMLFELWSACGRSGRLPRAWLKALLVPLHKKGPYDDPKNHRPISLLSHLRKIVEAAIDILLRRNYSNHVI